MENPVLIEPGVKYFLRETLHQCHEFKKKYNNFLFNIVLFIAFVLLVGIVLAMKYKGKPTSLERIKRNQEKEQYLLSKIKLLEEETRKKNEDLITGLPAW
jgi:uncharacterized membrane protein affecting hemolysin expression